MACFFKEIEMRHPSKPAFLNGKKIQKGGYFWRKELKLIKKKEDVKGENQGRWEKEKRRKYHRKCN
jgi:hypothetical protein